ncbi:MAG: RagB/SusD family nutrient uptake outer membrane protein, partial [Tannerellaceae bacterium]|nr:RagB/SusD family nutrient uptake outer membrane protein [Tannerellaceae bacterium]
MKTLYKALLIIFSISLFSVSCEDFLEEDPKGKLAQSTFFGTETDLDLAVHSLYRLAMDRCGANTRMVHMWAGDDISTHPASNKQDFRDFDRYQVAENSTRLRDEWTITYRLIKGANYI